MPAYTVQDIEFMLGDGMTMSGVAKALNIGRSSLYRFLEKSEVSDTARFRRVCKFNEDFFESIDTEEKAYWLGFLFADGCVFVKGNVRRVDINIGDVDVEHLYKFHNSICSCQRVRGHKDVVRSTHYSNKMVSDLMVLGCVPRKSLILDFPTINESLERHFIRGYFDGDGCIQWHRNKGKKGGIRVSFVGSESFLMGVQKVLERECDVPKKSLQLKGKARELSISGYSQALRVAKWMYEDSGVFLSRKYDRFVEFKKRIK